MAKLMPSTSLRRTSPIIISAAICLLGMVAAIWCHHQDALIFRHLVQMQSGGAMAGAIMIGPNRPFIIYHWFAVSCNIVALLGFTALLAAIAAYCQFTWGKSSLIAAIMVLPASLFAVSNHALYMYARELNVWLINQRHGNLGSTWLSWFSVCIALAIAIFVALFLSFRRLMMLFGRASYGSPCSTKVHRMPFIVLTTLFVLALTGAILSFRDYVIHIGHGFQSILPFILFTKWDDLVMSAPSSKLTVALGAVALACLILLAVLAAVKIGRLTPLPILQMLLLMTISIVLPLIIARSPHLYDSFINWLWALRESVIAIVVFLALYVWMSITLQKATKRHIAPYR